MMGTPKTLTSAVQAALAEERLMLGTVERTVVAHVKDFLNQKFGAAFLAAGEDSKLLAVLEDLHKSITLGTK